MTLTYKRTTREVTITESIREAEIKLFWRDVREIIISHTRNQYNLGKDSELELSLHADGAITVTVTEVVKP